MKIGTKVVGSATPLYRRGIFYVSEFGNCEVSVFNENKTMIVIVPKKYIHSNENHSEVKPVIFNLKDKSETEEMFRNLQTTFCGWKINSSADCCSINRKDKVNQDE